MAWDSPGGILGQIGWGGAVLALGLTAGVFALFLLATRPALRVGPAPAPLWRLWLGGLVSFGAAALLFPPALALVQVPLQSALGRWTMANLATANQAILMLPVVLASGLVQEPVKLLSALAGIVPAGLARRSDGGPAALILWRAVVVGAAAGAGFGGFEAAVVLSPALGTGLAATGGVFALAPAVIERFSAIIFHLATAGLVTFAWSRSVGRGLTALGALILVHGLLNYFALLIARPGLGAVLATETFIALVSVTLVAYLVGLLRREARKGTDS